mgnify:CR=1 FL=1
MSRSRYELRGGLPAVGTGGTLTGGAELAHPGSTPVHYSTIAAALAASVSGDLVTAALGDHAESVTIPAGVMLRGYGRDQTCIKGQPQRATS